MYKQSIKNELARTRCSFYIRMKILRGELTEITQNDHSAEEGEKDLLLVRMTSGINVHDSFTILHDL